LKAFSFAQFKCASGFTLKIKKPAAQTRDEGGATGFDYTKKISLMK